MVDEVNISVSYVSLNLAEIERAVILSMQILIATGLFKEFATL